MISHYLLLFLLPLFLKYFISRSSSYVKIKASLDKNIILEEYHKLKQQYPLLLAKTTGEQIAMEERYEDPPFNLKPIIIERNTGVEEEFMNHLHGI